MEGQHWHLMAGGGFLRKKGVGDADGVEFHIAGAQCTSPLWSESTQRSKKRNGRGKSLLLIDTVSSRWFVRHLSLKIPRVVRGVCHPSVQSPTCARWSVIAESGECSASAGWSRARRAGLCQSPSAKPRWPQHSTAQHSTAQHTPHTGCLMW
jgi:hypothetical protein